MLAIHAGCGAAGEPNVQVVDLLKQFDDAEKRPTSAAFPIAEHTFGGATRASIIAPANSRVTFRPRLPRNGMFRADAAVSPDDGPASVNFRIGISDGRVYETLHEQVVATDGSANADWTTITADLSLYAGPKFSLFYQPDRRQWQLVLGTNIIQGSPGAILWGGPGLYTDRKGARTYVEEARRSD